MPSQVSLPLRLWVDRSAVLAFGVVADVAVDSPLVWRNETERVSMLGFRLLRERVCAKDIPVRIVAMTVGQSSHCANVHCPSDLSEDFSLAAAFTAKMIASVTSLPSARRTIFSDASIP